MRLPRGHFARVLDIGFYFFAEICLVKRLVKQYFINTLKLRQGKFFRQELKGHTRIVYLVFQPFAAVVDYFFVVEGQFFIFQLVKGVKLRRRFQFLYRHKRKIRDRYYPHSRVPVYFAPGVKLLTIDVMKPRLGFYAAADSIVKTFVNAHKHPR